MAIPAGVIAGLQALPAIVSGVDTVIDALGSRGGPSAPTAAQAGLLSGGFAGPTLSTGTQVATSVGPTPVAFSGVPQVVGPAARAIIPRLPMPRRLPIPGLPDLPGGNGVTTICRPVTKLQAVLMQARAATGEPVSARKIRDTARMCGLEVAAARFGISVTDVCEVVVSRRRRRSRGITSRDMRNCNRVLRQIGTLQKNAKAALAGRKC